MQLRSLLAKVRRIPAGKVASYGEVARAAGYPGAARQVVWALNLSAPDVPWHRVVGARGRILLRGTQGQEQRLRLESEGVRFENGRIRREHWHQFDEKRGDHAKLRRST